MNDRTIFENSINTYQNTGERLWANKRGMLMQTLVTQIIAETLACVIAGVILHLFFDEKGHQK